jgi:hypothetical protein
VCAIATCSSYKSAGGFKGGEHLNENNEDVLEGNLSD